MSNISLDNMVSLFAGIGGFELGFNSIGVTTTLTCEIDPIAQHILKNRIPEAELVSDICSLKSLPSDTSILCAGFPCQDISTIGIKKGLSGTRSSLIKEVFRLLKRTKVEWVVIENVTNMLHLNNGEVINTIVTELEGLGYNWAYRTIDSLSFVPQHRKRVYVVASRHFDPRRVLLSDDSSVVIDRVSQDCAKHSCGFYWTEGKYAIGLYKDAIPTLKCGSTIGIASPPAILFPNGDISCPDIRDAERLQGFPADWTEPAEEIAKPSCRWKLVGNAVTVDVVSWVANKIISPQDYDYSNDREISNDEKWPSAAWGMNKKRHVSSVSAYPIERQEIPLERFLEYPCRPLSHKAAIGFEKRLNSGTVKSPLFFTEAVHNYVISKTE